MSASSSTPGERDLDALRRAQRAHEPSMEEILASIRSIIADDREPAAARTAPKPDAAPNGPQIVYSKDESAPARVAEPPPPAEPATPKVVWSQPQPQATTPASPPNPEPAAAPAATEEPAAPLLSDQAARRFRPPSTPSRPAWRCRAPSSPRTSRARSCGRC